ncbi:hypothetical protein MPDQ_005902 [Monascus purpureus]|uniref:Rho-GAP domain-containing protein n=1 Tax=Monascus purpureus TaxID=5098 RepID=A0A507QW00_MONPU|nr:hypothetical protein MPDQ_005902 [Monascus purpureus]
MPYRHSTISNLDLSSYTMGKNPKKLSPLAPSVRSPDDQGPLTPSSPKSSPPPYDRDTTIRPVTQDSSNNSDGSTFASSPPATNFNPSLTAIPQYPPSPKDSPKHNRDVSKSFFATLKAPKSSHKSQGSNSPGHLAEKPKSRGSSRDRRTQISSKPYGSSPDLLSTVQNASTFNDKNSRHLGHKKSGGDGELGLTVKKSKPRFANFLSRSRSIRLDDSAANRLAARRPSTSFLKLEETTELVTQDPPKSAPLHRDAINRNHIINRHIEPSRREKNYAASMNTSSSLSHVSEASAALFSGIKHSSSGAADRIGKAGKGIFGKITRSGSTNERELVNDDNYVCSVINLPLIEQTRRTRISKKLESSRDKTEFWMPALPYRCIDYLNFKGCEEEGLYRVPGSGKEVKHWQRRFDTEYDVDLFEEPDLYDINTIGSMFKAWLRELPDELLPKSTQAMIAEKCEGATTAPQLLKDELSKLPPYNYYLLFAITCHLNLLHSYVDQNKMDYRNLCICFQPCMKIDAFCFQFLVCDWKNCWQGCWTEKEYLKEEYELFEKEARAKELVSRTLPESAVGEERAVSSASSQTAEEEPCGPPPKTRKQRPPRLESVHSRTVSQLPELGPPLSPIQI